MVKNEELIKFIFNEFKKIKNSKWSRSFLEQILNSDSSFVVDVDSAEDLYIWHNGNWQNGTWDGGKWEDGAWYNGTWKNGTWKNGIWRNGYWEKGTWKNGIWIKGTWKNGYWIKGTWENGIWIKGKIYNKNTKKFQESELPPNKVKWSLSYAKK